MSEAPPIDTLGWTLNQWQQAYRLQQLSPDKLLSRLLETLADQAGAESCWIQLADSQQLAEQLKELAQLYQDVAEDLTALPLYGVPFAVKDNLDVAGWITTAACPEYAYQAQQDAEVVRLLKRAGAVLLGKTNLDQFATGLVGTRSPYGAVSNPFNGDYISGGSSSGSAVVVAQGYVPFALGSDTAGSGRVPAAFNHIIGLKPSRGLLSTRGLVPACRSLDCISIFAQNISDADQILQLAARYDSDDSYARPRPAVRSKNLGYLAIPKDPEWFGDLAQQQAFELACAKATELGYPLLELDFSPMFALAELLYQGPWVAERYAAVGEFIEQDLRSLNPVVKNIILAGKEPSAVQLFNAEYQRQALCREIQKIFHRVDALLVPSTPRFPSQAEVAAEPVGVNSQLGLYTNFVNLADLCALAIPAPARRDGLPFGITLVAPAWQETALSQFARHWQQQLQLLSAPALLGQTEQGQVTLAVVGAHLSGMPLNHQLTSRHARFLEQTLTAKKYQLYALANTQPAKPGLVRTNDANQGHEIIVELWRLSDAAFGSFVAEIPQPLGIGTLELQDGRLVKGFICEPAAINSATHISEFGGWRAYIEHLNQRS